MSLSVEPRVKKRLNIRSAAAVLACGLLLTGSAQGQTNITNDPSQVEIPQGEPVAFTPLAHVEEMGEGPIDVVLIPALGCDWTVWRSFMERNSERYTCYAVTLPGMAGTDAPPKPTSVSGTPWLNNAVEAIARMIDERELENPVVIGHSFGGQVAVRFGCVHEDLVRSVITVDGMLALPLRSAANRAEPGRVFDIETNFYSVASQMTREQWDKALEDMVAGWVKPGPQKDELTAMVKKTPTAALTQYMQEFYKTDLTDDALQFDKPLMAIAAISGSYAAAGVTAEDLKLRWETQLAQLPNETLLYLENTRHFVPWEAPDKLDRAVRAFMARSTTPVR